MDIKTISKVKRLNIFTSYLIGAPVGFITTLVVISIPVILTGEGLPTIAFLGIYGKPTIGMIISFLIALGYAGSKAHKNAMKNYSLLTLSFRYSLLINLIIWTVFITIALLDNLHGMIFFVIVPPMIAFLFCTLISTFSIGLLICYIIKDRVKNLNQ